MYRLDISKTALQLLQEKLTTFTTMAKTFSQNSQNAVIGFNANCLQENYATYFKLASGCSDSRVVLQEANFLTSNKIKSTPLAAHTTSNIEHQVGTTCSKRRLARLVRLWNCSLMCRNIILHVCWRMLHRCYYTVHRSWCTNLFVMNWLCCL